MSAVHQHGAASALLDADDPALFPKLTGAQVELLARHGEVRPTATGEVLFRQGSDTYDVMVVLEGTISVLVGSGEDERELVTQGPGDLMVELNLFTGQGTGATGIVREPGSVLAVGANEFRELVRRDLSFGDFVFQTLFRRRRALERLQLGIRVVGSRFDRDTQRLREFAMRNRLLHEWVDADDPRAQQWLADLGISDATSGPVVLLEASRFLINPTDGELAGATGLRPRPGAERRTYDLAVVGAGPGGLAASVYGAAGGLSTALIDAVAVGGQAATSGRIENYLGFPAGITGAELTSRAVSQARKFDARTATPYRAVSLEPGNGRHLVRLEEDHEIAARAVLLATGAQYRRLPVERLSDYEGLSVFYAAGPPEGRLCGGSRVAVVGGGNSAGQAAVWLSRGGALVTLLHRRADLRETMSAYLIRELDGAGVAVRDRSEIIELHGTDGRLASVTLQSGERIPFSFLFLFLGALPCTGWLEDAVKRDDDGFVLTGSAADAEFLLETSVPGIFAAGDVRSGSTKRCATAVGEGAMAVQFVHARLARDTVTA